MTKKISPSQRIVSLLSLFLFIFLLAACSDGANTNTNRTQSTPTSASRLSPTATVSPVPTQTFESSYFSILYPEAWTIDSHIEKAYTFTDLGFAFSVAWDVNPVDIPTKQDDLLKSHPNHAVGIAPTRTMNDIVWQQQKWMQQAPEAAYTFIFLLSQQPQKGDGYVWIYYTCKCMDETFTNYEQSLFGPMLQSFKIK